MQQEDREYQPPYMPGYQNPRDSMGSSILYMTNPEPEIEQIKLQLEGKAQDEQGRTVKIGEPILNKVGIQKIIGALKALSTQTLIMSNLDKRDVQNMAIEFSDALIIDLLMNKKNYELKDENRDMLHTTITLFIYSSFKRAFEEGDRRFWKGSVQELQHTIHQEGKKSGLMSKWFGKE